MDRFVSTFTNRIDAKGRVSIPASYRAVLERDGYANGANLGIYCYPSLDAAALDAGGERLARAIDALLADLPSYSDERDELSVALYGESQVLSLDGDGRVVLPEALRGHCGITTEVTFVGLGQKFQIWEPGRFDARRLSAREKVRETRKLLAASGANVASPASSPSGPLTAGRRGDDGAE
jgi:MraZ protein